MNANEINIGTVDAYAWPGCYPIGYVVDDGELLCSACVNDPTNPVHLDGDADGWRVEGLQVLEGTAEDYDGPVTCAHCGAFLVAPEDPDPLFHVAPQSLRDIAAGWHGGQWSALYALSSSGQPIPGLVAEIDECIALAVASGFDVARLTMLRAWAVRHEPDGEEG